MARKGWDSLSRDYRRRLERGGITEAKYTRGEGLHKARGHISKAHEQKQQRFWRLADKQLSGYFDREEIKEVADRIGLDEALSILDAREMALHPADDTERYLGAGAMRTLYGMYEGEVPREWLWYGSKG